MSSWRRESALLTRFVASGVLNTLVGFAVIFLLMFVGASPTLANVSGYAVGFWLGFVVSKKFVFRSDGEMAGESLRYLLAFLFSFLANLAVLQIGLGLRWNQILAQVIAAGAYTGTMFLLTRLFVFR